MKLKCPILLKPLATIVQQHYQSFYPSQPFRIIHFTMRHPVRQLFFSQLEISHVIHGPTAKNKHKCRAPQLLTTDSKEASHKSLYEDLLTRKIRLYIDITIELYLTPRIGKIKFCKHLMGTQLRIRIYSAINQLQKGLASIPFKSKKTMTFVQQCNGKKEVDIILWYKAEFGVRFL